jgi:RND family efflux transporter MFP subunit
VVLQVGVGVVFLAVLVLVIAVMAGVFGEKITPGYEEPARRKATAAEESDAYRVTARYKYYVAEAVGTLRAAQRTEISSRILAPIEQIKVKAGSIVGAGEPLVILDRRQLDAQRRQAQESLKAAQARAQTAQSEWQRSRELFEKRVISREEFDQATEKVNVTKAEFNRAQDALAEVDVQISYTTIQAPKAGMIVDRMAEPGNTARPGDPLLILYDPKSLRLEVPVMENLVGGLKVGDQLSAYIDALQRELPATVDEIVPQAEVASRSFLVKLKVPPSEDLFEGMAGRLKILPGKRRHLCLHTGTIEEIGQLQFVDVVGEGGVVERRYIKTGRMGDPNHVEVLSGLQEGDLVLMRSAAGQADPPGPGTEAPGNARKSRQSNE